MSLSIVISAWLIGTLGGLHCVAMCGGFMTAIAARDSGAGHGGTPLLPARTIVRRQFAYHVGRLATYTALGMAFGAAGGAALHATALVPVQQALYVIANIFLLLLGASLLTRVAGVAHLQRVGAGALSAALRALRPLLRRPGLAGRMTLGLVWGLVPCALVYGVLPLALFSGGTWNGGVVMFAFGLGTVPSLAVTGLLLDRTKRLVERTTLRRAAASLLVAFALVGIYRALYVPEAMGQGPFCLVP